MVFLLASWNSVLITDTDLLARLTRIGYSPEGVALQDSRSSRGA